jgi:methylated-DNA-[protein]-cysteine S-methyltransferase
MNRPTTSTTIRTTTLDSPVGELSIGVSPAGVRFVRWHGPSATAPEATGPEATGPDGSEPVAEAAAAAELLDRVVHELGEYFAGERRDFGVPLDPVGTRFQQEAWVVLRSIPYGSTMTYGEQARALGDPNRARAVGAANGRNPIGIIVPCHRVVGRDGSLTGFAGGVEAKAWLLDHERRIVATG